MAAGSPSPERSRQPRRPVCRAHVLALPGAPCSSPSRYATFETLYPAVGGSYVQKREKTAPSRRLLRDRRNSSSLSLEPFSRALLSSLALGPLLEVAEPATDATVAELVATNAFGWSYAGLYIFDSALAYQSKASLTYSCEGYASCGTLQTCVRNSGERPFSPGLLSRLSLPYGACVALEGAAEWSLRRGVVSHARLHRSQQEAPGNRASRTPD